MEHIQQYLTERLPAYLEMHHDMVAINSFTANPEGVNQLGNLTGQIFSRLAFEPEFVQSVNPGYGRHLFLSRLAPNSSHPGQTNAEGQGVSTGAAGDDHPTLALISHLDTVFPAQEEIQNNFHWRPEGDRIYGPGTVDIKGGTVLMYMLLEALREFYPSIFEGTNWLLALNASEEALSTDFTTELLQRLPESTRACLVFEGGTPAEGVFPLVVARKGRAALHVEVEGRSAHAGNNHAQGANALLQLAHTIQQIEALTDYSQGITFNVGKARGGSVVNRVPHYAEASVEMRAFSPEVFQRGVKRILALDGRTQVTSQDGFPCRVSVQLKERTSPWPENPKTDGLYAVWSESAAELGSRTRREKRGGLSDGNFLWQRFPTLDGLGPSGANAHCSETSADGSKEQEYVEASSFVPKTLLNLCAISRFFSLHD